jgi:lysine biosynthesis protein LysW
LTGRAAVYNTPDGPFPVPHCTEREQIPEEGFPVVRCPECATEIDVDEDEVEEGEILSCPECEVELEVVQVHPVQLNLISDEDEEEEESADSEDGDLLEDEGKKKEDEEEDDGDE